MKIKLIKNSSRNRIRLFSLILFAFISYSQGLLYLTPSDPIQYLLPVYNPDLSFEFIDRISLLLFLKFFSLFKIDPILMGSLSPFVLWIGIYLFSEKIVYQFDKSLKSTILFSILFNSSVFVLTLSQYLYPTILLVLIDLVIFYLLINHRKNNLYINFIFLLIPFLFFSKIQSIAFISYIFWQLYKLNKINFKNIVLLILSTLFIILIFYLLNTGSSDLSYYLVNQFKGRSSDLFPPFYAYFFEPSSLLIIFSTFFILTSNDKNLKKLGILNVWLFVYVILIYLITSRGGPLIYNYHLEFFIFGIISVSLFLTKSFNLKKYYLAISLSITGIIISLFLNVDSDNFHPAKIYYNYLNGAVNYQIIITSISLILIIVFFVISKYKKVIFPFLLLFLFMDSILKFKADYNFKISESKMIYGFLDVLNNDNQGIIYIPYPKSLETAYKYNMVVMASEFYFITNNSKFKFKFAETKTSSAELDIKLKTLTKKIK
jgi:hypothetical protein